METYDLIVIGAGPAGTSAAIVSRRSGARVLLLERGDFPRHKVCGEFVSAESLDLLSALLAAEHRHLLHQAPRVSGARLFVDGRLIDTQVNPSAASISRFELDRALCCSAEAMGVDLRKKTAVEEVRREALFQVVTTSARFRSRAVINASGRWSNLTADAAGLSADSKWIGLKAHFEEASPSPSVDLYFFEGGYCGVQPLSFGGPGMPSARVNACAMVRADLASNLPAVFALHSALQKRSRRWRAASPPVTTSPLIFRQPQPEHDGVMLAGDAAGFIDPFTGDGISLALRSGALAAACLAPFLAEETSLPEALRSYREAYQAGLASVFRHSSQIRKMLSLPRSIRRPILSLLVGTPAITRYLVQKTRPA